MCVLSEGILDCGVQVDHSRFFTMAMWMTHFCQYRWPYIYACSAILIVLKPGLGSFILEQLRDDYPLAYIFSVAVAPFSLGETPLQHYNTLLCLSWQQTYSDAVLLFQNDYVLQQAQKSTRAEKGAGRHSSEDVSVGEMNRHISQTLCNSFLPIWRAKQKWVHVNCHIYEYLYNYAIYIVECIYSSMHSYVWTVNKLLWKKTSLVVTQGAPIVRDVSPCGYIVS